MTIKERILLHLFEYTRFSEDYEAPPEVAQAGIGEAVGTRAQNVGRYIRDLVAENVVEERKSHIKGKQRQQKAYFLTPTGRQQASSQRTSLLGEGVPFRTVDGVEELPLSAVSQERRGSSLLQLLGELETGGEISSFQRLGEMRRVAGDFLGSNEAFRDALEHAKEEAVAAELHAQIASNYHVIWHLDEAEEEVRKGLQLLPPGPSVARAHLLLRTAEVAMYRRNYEMALHNVEEVMGWVAGGLDGGLEADARGLRGLVSIAHPTLDDAPRVLEDCRISLKIHEGPFAHYALGLANRYVGKTKDALYHFDRSADLAERMGDAPGRLRALFAKAHLLARLGRLESAEELYGETLSMASELHPWYRQIWHHLAMARLYWLQGRPEEARASLERFWQEAQELPVSADTIRVKVHATFDGVKGPSSPLGIIDESLRSPGSPGLSP